MLVHAKWTPRDTLQHSSRGQIVPSYLVGDVSEHGLVQSAIAVVAALMCRFNFLSKLLSDYIFRFSIKNGEVFAVYFGHEFVVEVCIRKISQVN